jgi:UDP-N-acetylglucosamine acyltransferase
MMTQPQIHPSALIEPGATLGAGCRIGPFCVIGPDVTLGDGVELQSHVLIEGHTTIGARTRIRAFSVIGGPPQHTGYKGEPTRVDIGADCDIREQVTIHRGTPGGRGVTSVGDRVFIMAQAHIAHDCRIEDEVILASQASLAGHVQIGRNAILSGIAGVHQFVRIGERAMIGGLAAVTMDVIPFGIAAGNHARLVGLNMVGLKRSGADRAALSSLRAAFRELFIADGPPFRERIAPVAERYADVAEVQKVIAFIRADASRKLAPVSRRRGDALELDE